MERNKKYFGITSLLIITLITIFANEQSLGEEITHRDIENIEKYLSEYGNPDNCYFVYGEYLTGSWFFYNGTSWYCGKIPTSDLKTPEHTTIHIDEFIYTMCEYNYSQISN